MTEVLDDLVYREPAEVVTRKNPFCVISKTANENGWHDLQTNSAWSSNPYGEDYAIVPDDMVESIMETFGYCDLVLNEDGTEVVSFTATEIPDIPVPEEEPTEVEVLQEEVTALQLALCEQYETNLALEEEVTNTQLALCELYEGGLE